MALRYSKYIPAISVTGDLIILNTLFVAGFMYLIPVAAPVSAKYVLFYLYLNFIYLFLVLTFRAYLFRRHSHKKEIFVTTLKISIFYFFLFLLFFQLITLPAYYPRAYIKYIFPLFLFLLLVWKFTLYYGFLFYRKLGYGFRNVLIFGNSDKTRQLFNYLNENKWHGFNCLGLIGSKTNESSKIVGTWNDFQHLIDEKNVDEVFIDTQAIPEDWKDEVLRIIAGFPLKVHIIPSLGNFALKRAELVHLGDLEIIEIQPGPLSAWYNQLVKRLVDIFLSVLVIASILSWLSLILFLIDLFGYRRGIFFLQRRTSMQGNPFTCIKFRSMVINDEADKIMARKNDERVTKVGRFLRKTSIDELPQFFNVLAGQMSVVGPRPHMLKHTEEYRKRIKNFMIRHTVKPGITGQAQVNGYRGAIKTMADLEGRLREDVKYIENWTLWLDFKIMLLTIWVLLVGQEQAY